MTGGAGSRTGVGVSVGAGCGVSAGTDCTRMRACVPGAGSGREFVALGLGSNRPWNGMGCVELLRAACRALSASVRELRVSSVYRTTPMYVREQDDFYNMAACGFVEGIGPHALLAEIHRVEASLGRDRALEVRNGPRSIDIDIELFGVRTVRTADLEIPHPRLLERAFVLVPLVEILPEYSDSIGSGAFSAALARITRGGTGGVERFLPAHDFWNGR